jgi:hypothetical protein
MKKNYFFIMPLCIIVLYSCTKNNATVTKPQVVDVYVAGIENNGSFDVAKYWKNGVPVNLSDGTSQACANSIVVSDGDVYVAGWVRDSSTQTAIAVYWKNGIAVNLSNGSPDTYATSIAVSGNDFYVTGTQYVNEVNFQSTAKYWENGGFFEFSGGSSVATSIAVSGTDVYVAGNNGFYLPGSYLPGGNAGTGNSSSNAGGSIAEYWKNGNVVSLTPPIIPYSYCVNSIVVSGNDVYVAGSTSNGYFAQSAIYWKNGNLVNLAAVNTNAVDTGSNATSIAVAGNDVYVAGSKSWYPNYVNNSVAQYWKNGTPVVLTDQSHLGYATSIAVAGNDVYVAGVEYTLVAPFITRPSIATYWKNGNLVNLTDGSKNATANSIFLSVQ